MGKNDIKDLLESLGYSIAKMKSCSQLVKYLNGNAINQLSIAAVGKGTCTTSYDAITVKK